MKKLLLAIIIFLATTMTAYAIDVTLRWEANTEPDLAGYRIYRSATSGSGYVLAGTVLQPTTQFTDLNIPDGKWYWVATAFDTDNLESGYSNEVTETLDSLPPAPPKNLSIWERIYSWLMKLFGMFGRV